MDEYVKSLMTSLTGDLQRLKRQYLGDLERRDCQELLTQLREHRKELDELLHNVEEQLNEHLFSAFERCAHVVDGFDKIEELVRRIEEQQRDNNEQV